MHFDVRAVPADDYAKWIAGAKADGADARHGSLRRARQAEHERRGPRPIAAIDAEAVRRDRRRDRAGRGRAAKRSRAARTRRSREEGDLMLGKLSWSAIPFDQPIPLAASVADDPRRPRRARPG